MYYCSVLSLCPVFSFPFSVHNKTNKYINQSYNKDYYNNNHYTIGNLFLPACVVRLVCPRGKQGLVKTFTSWQVLASWQELASWQILDGAGGCSLLRITEGQRWQFLTIHIENVIISVAMITKKLLVTRAPNLRCTAFFLFRV